MPRRSSTRSRKASAPNAREVASAAPRDATPTRREHAALVLVVAMILASQWLVDPRAADAFEALKRIVVRLGAVAAIVALGPEAVGAALLAPVAGAPTTTARRRARAVTALVGLVLAWGLCSVCAAPHRDVALDGWRGMVFAITLAALGASRALDGKRARIALGAFWVAAAVTALASLLETAGGLALFDIRELGGRARGVALVGNEGVVALVMALAASSAAAVLVIQRESRGWLGKGAAAALLAVTIAALVGTGNLTGWLALAAGVAVVFAARLRRRLAWALLGLGLVLGLGVATVAPLRARLALTTSTLRRADWTVALTYRPIAWRAALEGVRERPLLGQGPGTFESNFVRLRLAAEQRLGRRLVKPELNAHFDAAHDEYLDAAAALGVPGALALVAVCGYLLARLVALLRPPAADPAPLPNHRDDADTALVCLAVLASAAVASSTWFPLQRLSSSVAILLVAGRAARVACGERAATTLEPHRRSRAVGVASIAVLALLALPELPRYRAERAIASLEARVAPFATAVARAPSAAFVHAAEESARGALRWVPGDTRGLAAAGAAALFARDGASALRLYGLAIARTERAELVLDVGRAAALLDRRPEALAAFVRAVWLTPRLADELPEAAKPLVADEIRRREALLASGAPDAIPPATPSAVP